MIPVDLSGEIENVRADDKRESSTLQAVEPATQLILIIHSQCSTFRTVSIQIHRLVEWLNLFSQAGEQEARREIIVLMRHARPDLFIRIPVGLHP
jgi:hypothetical protein